MRLVLIALLLLGACVEPPPPSSTGTSLRTPAQAPLARVPLEPLKLETQADYDALEDRWLARRERSDLVAVLQAYADAKKTPDPLLLQRIAVLLADDVAIDEDALRVTLEAGSKLRAIAPDSPHTAWLNGWVLWQFLSRSGFGTLDGSSRQVADAIVSEWKTLIRTAPDYVGPRKHGIDQVKRAVARIEAALAEAARPATAVTAPPPRMASPVEIEALAAMARFEEGNPNARRSLCEEWVARSLAASPSLAERRLLASCYMQLGDVPKAVASFATLRELDGVAFDACAALGILRERVGNKTVDDSIKASGTTFACP